MKKILFLSCVIFMAVALAGCSIMPQDPAPMFIAVHLEPVMEDGEQGGTNRPERYWNSVVSLIEAADEYNQKLTLMMNPQWGIYIFQNESRLASVHSWEDNGHEIALHYHGPSMGSLWSGYTNQIAYQNDPRFQGSTEDVMKIMNQVTRKNVISTCTANDADADKEFPSDATFSTDGGLYGANDLVSEPEQVILNGEQVLQLSHAKYGEGGQSSVLLADIKHAFQTHAKDEYIGIVFHDKAFEERPGVFLELFEWLYRQNLQTQTVSSILKSYK